MAVLSEHLRRAGPALQPTQPLRFSRALAMLVKGRAAWKVISTCGVIHPRAKGYDSTLQLTSAWHMRLLLMRFTSAESRVKSASS